MFKRPEIKILALVILISLIGIFSSAFLLDKCIDNYITKLQPQVKTEVVVNLYNNTDNKVTIDKDDKGNIDVHIDKNKAINNNEANNNKPKQGIIIATSGLNIREKSDINSDVIGALDYGSKVNILDETQYWYKIDKGFIYKNYVELNE